MTMNYNDAMFDYDILLEQVAKQCLPEDEERVDRTTTGTLCSFGNNVMNFYNIWESIPFATGKKIALKTTFMELKWFLSGGTKISELYKGAHPWWKPFAKNTDPINFDYLGKIYGAQWRNWEGADGKRVDQIKNVIEQIKTNPFSRRHIVSAWNAAEIEGMALPPCHVLFQFYVSNDGHLDCQLYQRSGDMFLGVPVNIASYSMLMHLVAAATDLKPRNFYHLIADAHIYKDHVDQVDEYIRRVKSGENSRANTTFRLTEIGIEKAKIDIALVDWDDVVIEGYEPMESIKANMSV